MKHLKIFNNYTKVSENLADYKLFASLDLKKLLPSKEKLIPILNRVFLEEEFMKLCQLHGFPPLIGSELKYETTFLDETKTKLSNKLLNVSSFSSKEEMAKKIGDQDTDNLLDDINTTSVDKVGNFINNGIKITSVLEFNTFIKKGIIAPPKGERIPFVELHTKGVFCVFFGDFPRFEIPYELESDGYIDNPNNDDVSSFITNFLIKLHSEVIMELKDSAQIKSKK